MKLLLKLDIDKISGKGLILVNTEQKVIQVPIEDIIPNRFQPRLAFDEEGLKELSESIKQHGIIQPLVLRRLGDKYEIIAGERRYKAATMAGLRTVPAIISDIDDNKSAEIALVENIQRRNLTPIEEAKSYKNLLDRGYMTQEQLAEKMGVSQSSIANKLRLLNLAPEVQDALLQEKISERHARSLLSLPKEEQAEWLQKIITKRLTVRQLDLEIKKAKGEQGEEIPLVSSQPDLNTMINNATDINPTQVQEKTPTKEPAIEEKNTPNKFFNFLEDEAANMNMTINSNLNTPIEENQAEDTNIEVLDDFSLEESPKEESKKQDDDTIMPFFFGSNTTENKEKNTIEEIKNTPQETIIDPMDSVIKLDPNYNKKIEEAQGLDLKTAINEVRDLVEQLKARGFQINLDEIDLSGNYQMTISIKNND